MRRLICSSTTCRRSSRGVISRHPLTDAAAGVGDAQVLSRRSGARRRRRPGRPAARGSSRRSLGPGLARPQEGLDGAVELVVAPAEDGAEQGEDYEEALHVREGKRTVQVRCAWSGADHGGCRYTGRTRPQKGLEPMGPRPGRSRPSAATAGAPALCSAGSCDRSTAAARAQRTGAVPWNRLRWNGGCGPRAPGPVAGREGGGLCCLSREESGRPLSDHGRVEESPGSTGQGGC